MKKYWKKIVGTLIVLLMIYTGFYAALIQRPPARNRTGTYVHFRNCPSTLIAYIFLPAAYVESWGIRAKNALFGPSGTNKLPEVVLLKSPNFSLYLPFSPAKTHTL